ERLEDGPGGAEDGLLVADLDVAPGEEVEQFAVAPQLAEVDEPPAGLPLDDRDRQILGLDGRRRGSLGRGRHFLVGKRLSDRTHDASRSQRTAPVARRGICWPGQNQAWRRRSRPGHRSRWRSGWAGRAAPPRTRSPAGWPSAALVPQRANS